MKGEICEFVGPDEFAKSFLLSRTPTSLVISRRGRFLVYSARAQDGPQEIERN